MQVGDIAFSRVGSIDRNALIREREDGWLFSGRLLRVRVNNEKYDSRYLSYHFHSEPFKQRVHSVAVGQTMPSLNLGKVQRLKDATGRYIEFCKGTFPYDLDLRGLRIVVDCAHGAAYHIAGHVMLELGADVITICAEPDGFNINHECGATNNAT